MKECKDFTYLRSVYGDKVSDYDEKIVFPNGVMYIVGKLDAKKLVEKTLTLIS